MKKEKEGKNNKEEREKIWLPFEEHRCERWNALADDEELMTKEEVKSFKEFYGFSPPEEICSVLVKNIVKHPVIQQIINQARQEEREKLKIYEKRKY